MRLDFTTLPLWAGLVPLGLYLVGLGIVHLRRRPQVIAGPWDIGLLVASVAGLVAVGPLAILQPVGGSPWTVLVAATVVVPLAMIAVVAARPRLVVYNVTLDQLRPVVAEVVNGLDPAARWAGETAALPSRGVQVHLDGRGAMRTVSVVAVGARTSAEGWSEFSRRLRQSLRSSRVRSSPWGVAFVGCGAVVLAAAAWLGLRPPSTSPSSVGPPPGAFHAHAVRPVAA